MSPLLITEAEAAEMLGLATTTLVIWRKDGRGPAFVRMAKGRICYRPEDVIAWLDSQVTSQ